MILVISQITKRGEVVDEPTFRYTTARKEHRAHVKELMSQAVINKTLELEVGIFTKYDMMWNIVVLTLVSSMKI